MLTRKIGVLFVCAGNICRSPTAEGVFRHQARRAGALDDLDVDSAGTTGYHTGEAPDRRSAAAALKRGYDLSALRARQVAGDDFARFDYVLAMDRSNLADLKLLRPRDFGGRLGLFLDFAPSLHGREVPDPYYGGVRGFEDVLDLVEAAAAGLLQDVLAARARRGGITGRPQDGMRIDAQEIPRQD